MINEELMLAGIEKALYVDSLSEDEIMEKLDIPMQTLQPLLRKIYKERRRQPLKTNKLTCGSKYKNMSLRVPIKDWKIMHEVFTNMWKYSGDWRARKYRSWTFCRLIRSVDKLMKNNRELFDELFVF